MNATALRAKADRYEKAVGVPPLFRAEGYLQRSDFYDRPTGALRFLVEGFFDHRVLDWNMEATLRSYDFDISGGISGLKSPIFRLLLDSDGDREIGRLRSERHRFDYHKACRELRKRHFETFPFTARNRARVERALDQLQELSVPDGTQAGPPSGKAPMPPGAPLSPEKRRAIESFVDKLKWRFTAALSRPSRPESIGNRPR